MRYLLVFLLPISAFALQARDLIGDAAKLYELTRSGAPEKRAVALRYADLLFDGALEIHGDSKSSARDLERAESYRRKALSLYQESQGSLKGLSALRAKFQISRLHAYAGQMGPAIRIWRELSRQNEDLNIKRESSLHLAEQLELANSRESIGEALRLYQSSLNLSEKPTLRSYILYRTAWTQFRLGEPSKAVATLKSSIGLASPREYPDLLKDMVLFLSREDKPCGPQIRLLTDYEKNLKVPGLVENLAEAYFTADRTLDYVQTLKYLNEQQPSADRAIALLDTGHDRMSIKEIRAQLSEIRELGPVPAKSQKKSCEALFRLAQYWDGQRRAGHSEFVPVLTDGVTTQLVLFPQNEETKKSVSGWLAAVTDPSVQVKQLGLWAESGLPAPAELLVRQHRLEIARKEKLWPLVVEDSARLETLAADNRRPVRYQRAKALYELKEYEEALPLFIALADETKPDEIREFSRDLALDIWNQRRDFEALIDHAGRWEKLKIRDQALFERAASQKNNASLTQFSAFCLNRQFLPQSCDNAKALAVELRDQNALIGVLKFQKDEPELARQLEVAARFKESAVLLEKRAGDYLSLMKVALLYEMQGENASRDRILKRVSQDARKGKLKLDANQERLLLGTLADAGLMDRETALKSCENYGESWRKFQRSAIDDLDQRQAKINFLGAHSQAKFQNRAKLLGQMSAQADCFVKGALAPDKHEVAAQVSQAYADFRDKILSTPIPEGLAASDAAEIKAQIAAMAAPFDERSEAWRRTSAALADSSPLASAPIAAAGKFDWQEQLRQLQADPFNREKALGLKIHFENSGRKRLAAYMDGRLQGLERQ